MHYIVYSIIGYQLPCRYTLVYMTHASENTRQVKYGVMSPCIPTPVYKKSQEGIIGKFRAVG